jgi:hypothetical protein
VDLPQAAREVTRTRAPSGPLRGPTDLRGNVPAGSSPCMAENGVGDRR